MRDFDGWGFLENARIPIYEVYGEMGRHESTEELLRIPSNPNIQIRWIPGSGHYLPHERPVEVAEICVNLIAQSRMNVLRLDNTHF